MNEVVYVVMCECYINKRRNYTMIRLVSNNKWSTYEAAYNEAVKYLEDEDILEVWIETKHISRIVGV